MHDSGKREEFDTGAVRDTAEGKVSFRLVSPFLMLDWAKSRAENLKPQGGQCTPGAFIIWECAAMYELTLDRAYLLAAFCKALDLWGWGRLSSRLGRGAKKYADRNWEKGMGQSRTLDSLYRHLLAITEGEEEEDHCAAVMCNLMFAYHYHCAADAGVLDPAKIMDLPDYTAKPKESSNESV